MLYKKKREVLFDLPRPPPPGTRPLQTIPHPRARRAGLVPGVARGGMVTGKIEPCITDRSKSTHATPVTDIEKTPLPDGGHIGRGFWQRLPSPPTTYFYACTHFFSGFSPKEKLFEPLRRRESSSTRFLTHVQLLIQKLDRVDSFAAYAYSKKCANLFVCITFRLRVWGRR